MSLSQVDFLFHILDECTYLIREYNSNTYDDFISNERLTKAICRSLEIIGEASSKLHPDLKSKYSFIPWREMSDLRNRIIHHYFGVDYDIVWDVLKSDIPELHEAVTLLIAQERQK